MPEFSACYFCGTALDDPLSEYPVVPKELQPAAEQQGTVVLCPTCRRKLGAVVDAVLQAVDEDFGDESIQREKSESSASAASAIDDNENTGEGTASSDAGGFEFREPDAADSLDDAKDEANGEDGANADDEPAPEDEADTEAEAQEDDDADGSAGADDDADETVSSDEATTSDDTATSDQTSASDDEPQLTALEYNRVMRLLQNREFPVDLEEFRVVATGAYELRDDEFERIIQAAVDRDLIALEGDQIVDG